MIGKQSGRIVKLFYVPERHTNIEVERHVCGREYCGRWVVRVLTHDPLHLPCLPKCRGQMHLTGSGKPTSSTLLRYWECWVCKRRARTNHNGNTLVIAGLGRAV